MSDKSYDCWNCCDYGCPCCQEEFSVKVPRDGSEPTESIVERINAYVPEPWPKETWLDLTDADLEQLVCDGLNELSRRGKRRDRLERMWTL